MFKQDYRGAKSALSLLFAPAEDDIRAQQMSLEPAHVLEKLHDNGIGPVPMNDEGLRFELDSNGSVVFRPIDHGPSTQGEIKGSPFYMAPTPEYWSPESVQARSMLFDGGKEQFIKMLTSHGLGISEDVKGTPDYRSPEMDQMIKLGLTDEKRPLTKEEIEAALEIIKESMGKKPEKNEGEQ